MAIKIRNGVFYLYFRPFRKQQVGLRLDVTTKTEARQLEAIMTRACRTGNYAGLDVIARELCVRMFQNQGWKLPQELGNGRPAAPGEEMTLWNACEQFLKYPGIQEHPSRWRYECCILHLVEKIGKETPVKSIRIPDLKSYQVDRKNQGAAASTVNWELSTLSKIFNTLMEIQYVDANPARMVKRLSTREEEREVYLGFSDVNAMVELCPPWVRPIVLTGYYTGMRRGEVLGLTWKQVNLSTRVVRLGPQDTKEGRRKRVPLRLEVIEILERSRRVRSQATGRVFLIDGRPPNKESIKNPWRKSCQALDLLDPRPRFHDLRHTWRANARRSGVDPVIAETILGHWHRQRSVNERYGRISDVEMLKAVDSMVFDNGMTEIIVDNKRRQ